jgi:hypothetical protein
MLAEFASGCIKSTPQTQRSHSNTSYCPCGLAAYKYRGKTFRFLVNARTGRVEGERPYSTWKIAIAIVLGLCVAGAVGYLYATNQGG